MASKTYTSEEMRKKAKVMLGGLGNGVITMPSQASSRDVAAMLRYAAAMVERCETKRNELNDKIENIKKRGDYGSCGSCRYEDCGCVWRKGCYTLPAEIEIPIETIDYILKGESDEER